MLRSCQSQSRGLLVLLAAAAIVAGACGSGSGTPAPSSTPTNTATSQSSATAQPSVVDAVASAGQALAGSKSFRFSMTVLGGTLGDTLSQLPASTTGSQAFTVAGTYVLKPAKAADVKVSGAGAIHVINTGGFDYVDADGSGNYSQNDASTSSLVDSLSPIGFYSAFSFVLADFDLKDSGLVNGVQANHYVVTDAGVAALAQMGSVQDIPDATWTAELWIATVGGYPVKLAVTAKVTDPSSGTTSTVFQRLFDITKIDDAGNSVTAPTNVTGA